MEVCSSFSNLSMQLWMKGLISSQWYNCCFLGGYTNSKQFTRSFEMIKMKPTLLGPLLRRQSSTHRGKKNLPVHTECNKQVEWEIPCKHLVQVFRQLSEHCTVTVLSLTLDLWIVSNYC